MREVGAFQAKNQLGTLLNDVAHGQEIGVSQLGKPVARLVPIEPGLDRAKAQRAAAGLLKMSEGLTLGGLSVKELTAEGRA